MTSLSVQVRVPVVTIESVAEGLHRPLNSIQAIAYYVEMTLPLSELASARYLHKVQQLVDECNEILQPFVQRCAVTESLVSEAIETNPDHDICVAAAGGGLP